MKKVTVLTLAMLLLVLSLSSCTPKYTFASPYVYENFTSAEPTYMYGEQYWYCVFQLTVPVTEHEITFSPNQIAAFVVASRKSSKSYFWYEKDWNNEWRECVYTVVELEILDVPEGDEEFARRLKEQGTIKLIQGYGIDPDGNIIDRKIVVQDENFTSEGIINYSLEHGQATRIIDNDEPFLLVLYNDKIPTKDSQWRFSSTSEKFIIPELEGSYHTPDIWQYTEEYYIKAKAFIEEYEAENGEDTKVFSHSKVMRIYTFVHYWEKFHDFPSDEIPSDNTPTDTTPNEP